MKYILPNFYNNFLCNDLIRQQYGPYVDFDGVQGTYPFGIFYGWYNNINKEELAIYRDLLAILKDYGVFANKVYLDMGNIILKDTDYYNCFETVILEAFAEKEDFYFEIADLNLIEFVINKFPNIQIILHQNYTMWHNESEILSVIEKWKDNIKAIIITDINPCFSVDNIRKIYLAHINKCGECKMLPKCLKADMEATLEYSTYSAFDNCLIYDYYTPEEVIDRIIKNKNFYNFDTVLFDTQCMNRSESEGPILTVIFEIIKDKKL